VTPVNHPLHTDLRRAVAGTSIDRRNLLRIGGLSAAAAALVAACGGTDSPGIARVGTAPTTTALPDAVVNDGVLLRTAASLERSVIDVYDVFLSEGFLPSSATELTQRFVADHTAHAEALDALTTAAGSEPFTCGNPRIGELVVPTILAAINGDDAAGIAPSDDPTRDALNVAFALESLAAETYQTFVQLLSLPELRREAMVIGGQEARHTSLLALAITGKPAGYLEIEPPAEPPKIPVAYALPSTFGTLAGITLVIGAEDEVGLRRTIALDTPSLNTYVYDYITPSC
jgi:hypothetical protein